MSRHLREDAVRLTHLCDGQLLIEEQLKISPEKTISARIAMSSGDSTPDYFLEKQLLAVQLVKCHVNREELNEQRS